MCGIVGTLAASPVNQLLYDALLLLQHRGQDAAGIVTLLERKFFMHKAKGMVRDVFRTRNMRALPGHSGLGQVRYPTAGDAYNEEEAQPFYVNAPFGIVLVHNGNLTNADALKAELFTTDERLKKLRDTVRADKKYGRAIGFRYHDGKPGIVEGLLSRGDRRVGAVIDHIFLWRGADSSPLVVALIGGGARAGK